MKSMVSKDVFKSKIILVHVQNYFSCQCNIKYKPIKLNKINTPTPMYSLTFNSEAEDFFSS
ncbi:hypothetical protein BpHYR1_035650 [Brachionus plicatilis]|uniref:Uncharacterized protein n=1 Tax=Brachionus plicatilis TaxID=10195 RepID=A0A3M7PTL4_BRAPC|nr:hypothetical protein BpHYR1_035650 [Brachionus plicatilis]